MRLFFVIMIVAVYLLNLIILATNDLLDLSSLIENLAMIIGWIVAILILYIQLDKTRQDNIRTQNDQIKKDIQIVAFKEVKKAFPQIINDIGSVSGFFWI